MTESTLTSKQRAAAVILVAAFVGLALSPVVLTAAEGTSASVAVVDVSGPILTPVADSVESELRDVRQNESIEAVVLKMNTPGGAAPASERMYMAVQRTAQDMPVIASVQQTSASGGYYTMLPAETIYVLPTSVTGSVGLAAGAPQPSEPVRGPSGPDKRGSNIIGTWATQETVADTFINTVMEQRSEQLEVPRSEVAHAKVYLGTRAVQNGFADKIGSVDEAIREAADEAELDTYQVVNRDIGVSGSPFGLEANAEPFLIRNDNRVFVVQGENPGVGDVRPMQFPLVHEEAVPHVDTVETVTNTELIAHTDQTEQRSQTTRPGGESQ